MKSICRPISLSFITFFSFCLLSTAQVSSSHQIEAIALQMVLQNKHVAPKPVNDTLSRYILRQVIDRIDSERLYLRQEDWQEMQTFATQLDDEIKGNTGWKFLPFVTTRYRERLLQAEKLITEQTQKPFVFSQTEKLVLSIHRTDSVHFAATETAYAAQWTRWLKYLTLNEMVQHTQEIVTGDMARIVAREPAARKKIQHAEQRKIRQILDAPGGYEQYMLNLFLDAIATCFDPHTNYMSRSEKEEFTSSLATEGMSFGMDLDENEKGEVVIDRLVPGGPAWKSNELHKGDALITIHWPGKPPVDLTDADQEEVEELLQSIEQKLELTVRQTNGLTKTVTLIREKVREDDNIVKGFLLQGSRKIGYISLPGFYTQWEEDGTNKGCANDVAREILKMKEARIEGLILDIRDNGGGSLQEGLNLAGIFIDEGVLGVLQGHEGKPQILKDMNRGTIYDGPLVVMVNRHSASASELLAATLQDYNRAVIVGSTTFGKATGQIILPLNVGTSPSPIKTVRSNWGLVKVTVDKIYRVTGKSAQQTGVHPHVYQPDIFESMNYRESTQPHVLSADSITKKLYYTPLKPLPVAELTRRSSSRLAGHSSFQAIRELVDIQQKKQEKPFREIVLHPAFFQTAKLESYKRLQTLEQALKQETKLFAVENTRYDQQIMQMDTYSKEINDVRRENIRKNIYIEEAYLVLLDLIDLWKP